METAEKKLILFEFAADTREWHQHCRDKNIPLDAFTVVALQPEVTVYCRENQLACTGTLPFFNNESHRRALEKSHRLSELVREHLRFQVDSSASNCYMDTFTYYSRFYLNNYTWIIEVLKGIRGAHAGEYVEIHVYDGKWEQRGGAPKPGGGAPPPFLVMRDRFVNTLAEDFCRAHDIPFFRITGPSAAPPAKVPGTPGLFYRWARALAAAAFKGLLKKLAPARPLFVASTDYNLGRLCREARIRLPRLRCVAHLKGSLSTLRYLKLFLKVLFRRALRDEIIAVPLELFETPEPQKEAALAQESRKRIDAFLEKQGKHFLYENTSLAGVWAQKARGDLVDYLVSLSRTVAAQALLLELLKPGLVITPVSIGHNQAWAECGRSLDIPALVIPQKGLLAPREEPAQVEEHYIGRAQVTGDFPYAAAQTPLVDQYLKWAGYEGTVLNTGNLIFARVTPDLREKKLRAFLPGVTPGQRVIVYAPSMKSRKSRRFFVLETMDELLSSIADLVRAVEGMDNMHLVLRVHPGEPITRKEIEALMELPANVTVSDRGTFEDILTVAHLVVSFSSTSIQEALVNGVPVVLYDKWKRYNHLQAPRVTAEETPELSPAYYIDTPAALIPSLRRILEQHQGGGLSYGVFKDYIYPARYHESFFELVKKYCGENDK